MIGGRGRMTCSVSLTLISTPWACTLEGKGKEVTNGENLKRDGHAAPLGSPIMTLRAVGFLVTSWQLR